MLTFLRNCLQTCLKDKYFGARVNQGLAHLDRHQRQKFESEAMTVYQSAIAYLKKRYDFEGTPIQHFL